MNCSGKKKKLIAALTVVAAFCLFGCTLRLGVVRREEDYAEFLKNLKTYYSDNGGNTENPEFSGPRISGFTPLYYTGFDYASAFSGGLGFVKSGGYFAVVSKDGEAYEAQGDLSGVGISFGKYVYEENGAKGVKSVFGDVLVPAAYDGIDIVGKTVSARNADGTHDIFVGGESVFARAPADAELMTEEYILSGGRLNDLRMIPVTCGSFSVMNAPSCGVWIVSDGAGVGYGNVSGEVIVAPEYDFVTNFVYGYGAARNDGGNWSVFDVRGNKIFELNADKTFVSFDGKYLLYAENGRIRIADAQLSDVALREFADITNGRVYGEIVVTDGGTRVYSLKEQAFIGDFVSVEPHENLFIAKTESGDSELYDENFGAIASGLEFAAFSENVLTVKADGKYYLYISE